jgi:hypothetical protein
MSDEEESSGSGGEEEPLDERAAKKARKGAPSSDIWVHVERTTNSSGKPAWRCKYCKDLKTGAPGRVKDHIVKCTKVSLTLDS